MLSYILLHISRCEAAAKRQCKEYKQDYFYADHCFSVVILNHVSRWCVFLSGELRPATRLSHL